MKEARWKRGLRGVCRVSLGLLCVGCVVALFSAVVLGLEVKLHRAAPQVGNSAANTSRLAGTVNADDFTFLVVGDVQGGMATFEELINTGRRDKPAFAVVVGDFVSRADPGEHKFFVRELTEMGTDFPVFLVPGNHDVDPKTFSARDYEALYGQAQFHFTLGKYLFIFLNNSCPEDPACEYLSYLERVLAEQAGSGRETFVFMHVPPTGLNFGILSRRLSGSERFMELMKKYGVRYVFTGDHHGYVKTVKDGTTYIVTGGGGAKLRGEHGRFHHMVRMAVNGDVVTESVIATEKKLEVAEQVERNLGAHLWPMLTKSPFHAFSGVALLVAAVGGLFYLTRAHFHDGVGLVAPSRFAPVDSGARGCPRSGRWRDEAEVERAELRLNRRVDVYPSNHVYELRRGRLFPGRKLARRLSLIQRLYPEPLDSMLDIGCAQGGFVFSAALRWPEARVAGIDVGDKYIELCQEMGEHLGLANVRFFLGHLEEFAEGLEDYGGPFQVVLLLNIYHYLYFGSRLDPSGYGDHGVIFSLLRRLCTGRLVFSSPLALKDCPSYIRGLARAEHYNEEEILSAARSYFEVERVGKVGKRPLFVLRAF